MTGADAVSDTLMGLESFTVGVHMVYHHTWLHPASIEGITFRLLLNVPELGPVFNFGKFELGQIDPL